MLYDGIILERRSEFSLYLSSWFKKNCRVFPWRKTHNPYKVFIAEVLLRKTSVVNVLIVYESFVGKYPDFQSLAKASLTDLENELKPLGLYRLRAKQLIQSAKIIVTKFSGQLPNSKNQLLELPGVGNYIANAVLCFAFDQKLPILDTNVIRVISRAFSFKSRRKRARDDPIMWQVATRLVPDNSVRSFNFALLDLASIICLPKNPKCPLCPLVSLCDYGQEVAEK